MQAAIAHLLKTEINMTQNRPWSVWWDFRWKDDDLKWIVVQTDHPQYRHVDYIYRFNIEDCEDKNGHVDTWIETWFTKFEDDVTSGRHSIHKIMKAMGHEKGQYIGH